MQRPPQSPLTPQDEARRLAALRRYAVLDTPPEAAFDRIVRLAAHLFAVPMALVSFLDADRQWVKAKVGPVPDETPRAIAFCNTAIEGRDICLVTDAALDPRFADHPLVHGGPRLRFYAGAPLLTPDGHAIGMICVLDIVPRLAPDAAQIAALADLAAAVMTQLELRHQIAARDAEMARAALRERLLRGVAETPTFHAAIDGAMTTLREDTQSLLCSFSRLAPDGHRLQVLATQGHGPLEGPTWQAQMRAMHLTQDNALAGLAIHEGRQIVIDDITPEVVDRFPGTAVYRQHGMVAMILTPVSVGDERYCLALGFGPGRQDLPAMAERLREAAGTLRPLLRRLRDAEETELFRRVVDANQEPVIISEVPADGTPNRRIRYVNDAFLRQTGFQAEQVIGQPTSILTHADAAPEARQAIWDSVAAGRPIRQVIRSRRGDGSPFWSELTLAPVADQGGWVSHWMGIQRDITAARAETEALTESEAAFRDLFQRHPAPMWVYDEETLAFLEVNEAAVAAYGWSRETFLGMTTMDLGTGDDREAARAAAKAPQEELRVTGPWPHLTASGEIRQVQTLSRSITFHGRQAGLVVVWDLTDRLRAKRPQGRS